MVTASTATVSMVMVSRAGIRAAQAGKGQQQVKAWVRRELISIAPDATFATMERLLLEVRPPTAMAEGSYGVRGRWGGVHTVAASVTYRMVTGGCSASCRARGTCFATSNTTRR